MDAIPKKMQVMIRVGLGLVLGLGLFLSVLRIGQCLSFPEIWAENIRRNSVRRNRLLTRSPKLDGVCLILTV